MKSKREAPLEGTVGARVDNNCLHCDRRAAGRDRDPASIQTMRHPNIREMSQTFGIANLCNVRWRRSRAFINRACDPSDSEAALGIPNVFFIFRAIKT